MSPVDLAKLLKWYKKLWSRTVDLVGDFLGSELFIIDGDSLLLECFSNKKLDFAPGFQLLHAIYIVEKFLQRLKQRKCVFEIVFFDSNAQFCIPPGSSGHMDDRYLFAREAIIHHLLAASQDTNLAFDVNVFESYHCESFQEHLLDAGVFLFMCHEGAMDENNEIDEVADDNDESSDDDSQEGNRDNNISGETEAIGTHLRASSSIIGLRLMIRWFITHGCNIALINNLEFRDTKIMAMVIQGTIGAQGDSLSEHEVMQADITDTTQSQSSDELKITKVFELLEMAISEDQGLTQSQCLLAVSLAIMWKAAPNRFADTLGFTTAILHQVVLQNIKLEDRIMPSAGAMDTAFFAVLLNTSKNVLISAFWKDAIKRHKLRCDLSDFADGRVFFQIQAILKDLCVDSVISPTTFSPLNKLASLVDHLCGVKLTVAKVHDHIEYITCDLNGSTSEKVLGREIVCESSKFINVLPFK